jgi:hypothetical protein
MKKATITIDPGLEEIAAWERWFRAAHEARLASPVFFPDRHLLDEERRRVDDMATAVVARMTADYLARDAKP